MRRFLSTLTLLWIVSVSQSAEGPFQATGFKVGEVTDSSAIVWTRLTLRPQRNPSTAPMVNIIFDKEKKRQPIKVEYPDGSDVNEIRFAAPGAEGEVRVHFRPKGEKAWKQTDWQVVDPKRDFTRQFKLTGLKANTSYEVKVTAKGKGESTISGGFKTAPKPDEASKVLFTVSTGQAFRDRDSDEGYNIYPSILKLDPSFFVHTGDIVYYDRLAKTEALARYHWQRTYSLPTNVKFHNNVASYFIKDDHDTWINDCWPTMKTKRMMDFTFKQGLAIFPEQVPMGDKTYRTYRWGKDLQIWLVEGRDFRSPNTMPDGPKKTIWGKEQKEWFKKTVKASDATFRILISPTPLVGPDRTNKNDNHANKGFTHEGNELRDFISKQKNMYIVCGDRHWQYVSVDPKSGVREYSCGPASNKHAGGWKQSDYRKEYHKYLKVKGGFLAVTVDRVKGEPRIIFRHHSDKGKVFHEDTFGAK